MVLISPPGPSASTPTPCAPKLRRIRAVINQASGGVETGAAEALAEIVAAHGFELTVARPEPGEIEGAIRAAIDAEPDLLILLAGDGTARLAAELCGPEGPLLAPLPGGTMNMLPHALYGPNRWREALAIALSQGCERPASGGRVGDRTFYCAAILGSPALFGLAREAVRVRKLRRAWRLARYAWRRAFHGGIGYSIGDGPRLAAEALVLITPLVSRRLDREVGLEAAALDLHDALEVLRLALNDLTGDWRRDPGVIMGLCDRGRVWAHRTLPCILDGEVHHLAASTEIAFIPRAFRALAPPQFPAQPA